MHQTYSVIVRIVLVLTSTNAVERRVSVTHSLVPLAWFLNGIMNIWTAWVSNAWTLTETNVASQWQDAMTFYLLQDM
jgi:hypothetical protein